MNDLFQLALIQLLFIGFFLFLVRAAVKNGKHLQFYMITITLYIMTLAWLAYECISMSATGNGGYLFAIGMYAMIIPAVLCAVSGMWSLVTHLKD